MSTSRDESYLGILRLAAPLVLTMSGQMVMEFVDALYLSWYSPRAIAAVIPAGMTYWLILSTFFGTAGYTSTLVAHYSGSQRLPRTSVTAWQGMYFSLAGGLIVMAFSVVAKPFFAFIGHEPQVQVMEATYFRVLCLGAPATILVNSLSGFFTGQGDTHTIFLTQGFGSLLNVALDYLLIFGKFGLPALGVAGAAIATVSAQVTVFLILIVLFLRPRYRETHQVWAGRRVDRPLFVRLMRFGVPSGIRFTVEMVSWTVFVFFIGRIGTVELASTNIAWRIYGIAFFPILGLSRAVSILVGKAQGRGEPDASQRVARRGILMSEVWMVAAIILFVTFPQQLYGLFRGPGNELFDQIADLGRILLPLCALYCVFDAVNIVLINTLQAAGDTRWAMLVTFVGTPVFLVVLTIADRLHVGLLSEWAVTIVYVALNTVVWVWRFRSGRWRGIEVVEQAA